MIYAIVAAAVFGAGAGAGFLGLVALAIRREERNRTMTLDAPDRITLGARVATGVSCRQPGVLYEAEYYPQALPPRP